MSDPVVLLSTGDVVGPAGGVTDNSMVLFSGTSGKLIKGNNAVVTAAGLALLDDVNAAAQRTTLGLGTAAAANVTTGTTDTTAGRVLKVGDFGLGTTAVNYGGDLNLLGNVTGFYRTISGATNFPNGCMDSCFVHIGSGDTYSQTIVGYNNNRMFTRGGVGVVPTINWQPWREVALTDSPAFTGTPTAPTASVGTSTTQVATTAFVNAEIANDAPTKTGGGASGSWGISIAGSAAWASGVDWSGVSGKPTTLGGYGITNGYAMDGVNTGWFRSSNASGWYNETYNGGIHMTDTTYVRTYNNKAFLCNNVMRVEGAQPQVQLWDSDHGVVRYLYADAGTIGFLNSSGSWNFNVDNAGNAWAAGSVTVGGAVNATNSCTAWVNFSGSGTAAIRSGYNVSSITDHGTGMYTVNFSSAMANTNYALGTFARHDAANNGKIVVSANSSATKTVWGVQIHTGTSNSSTSLNDSPEVGVLIFGGK